MTKPISRRILLLTAFLSAFLILMICSKSSFLYPMNDWVDVNCFFTVGRAMHHRKIPYLDLYEQKGPLLYFLFFLAALISESSFLGVFLLEVLYLTWFLYESAQIIRLWAGDHPMIFPALPLLALFICVSTAFSHGASAEELSLPGMAAALRIVLTQIRRKDSPTRKQMLALGFLCAWAFWTKYTFIGFYLGLLCGVLIWSLITHRFRQVSLSLLYAAAGALGLSLLVLLYFFLTGSLSSMFEAYFTNNLGAYTQSFGPRHDPPLVALMNNWPWSLPAAIGIVYLIVSFRDSMQELICILCAFCVLFFTTYLSGRTYPYYALVFSVFAPLGFVPVFKLLSRLPSRFPHGICLAATLLTLAISVGFARAGSGNVYLMSTPKEDMPQYRFAEIIRQTENATLLNDGFLDGGFYFVANVEPINRYFCTFNMRLPDMEQEHRQMIQEGITDFVVTRSKPLGQSSPYRVVDECTFRFEGRMWTYYLHQRIDD